MDLKDKSIVIIGGKRSGQALARLVVSLGARAVVSDWQGIDIYPETFRRWAAGQAVTLDPAGHSEELMKSCDVMVLSPGVPYQSEIVQRTLQQGIPVLGEIEFSSQFCQKPIIAVTGSNGKTTVSTLIHQVLQKAGRPSLLCGNIGAPFADHIEASQNVDYVVLEISSFQLESMLSPSAIEQSARSSNGLIFQGFRPLISVFLNFSQNHLDRHADLDEYFEAKRNLFMNQVPTDFAVMNAQDERMKAIADQLVPSVKWFNRSDEDFRDNPNFSAVRTVADLLGISRDICQEVFDKFGGVEHRLELVREWQGVAYINDSKATTVSSGRWALQSIKHPIIMICGGKDKNLDFTVLRGMVAEKVKKMFLIGEAQDKIKQAYSDLIEVELCPSLESAVQGASQTALPGDYVLFSPMCASFDMFDHFEHRGQVYKEIVHQLA